MKGAMMRGSKGGPSIAFLLGGKDKPAEEETEEGEYDEAGLEECRSHLETVFPDEDWSDDKRVQAMKDLVMAIVPKK